MDNLPQKDTAKDMKTDTKTTTFKPAFTMIELVFAIVVLGIIAAVAMPRLDRDRTQEASDGILSNIRYTQQMALNDFRHSFKDPNWQRSFWQIQFEGCAGDGMFFTIGADKDYGGDISESEAALDPSDAGLPMFWRNTASCDIDDDTSAASRNIFITKLYGVTNVEGHGGCENLQHIGFDHLGRPHVGFSGSGVPYYSSYMSEKCTFTFTVEDAPNFSISIAPETGYAHIVDQNAS